MKTSIAVRGAMSWALMVPGLIQGPTVQAQSIQSSQFRQYQALNSTIERALKAVMSGRFDEAKAILKPCLEKVPDHFEAHYLMALMAYEARDFAGALAGLETAERTLGNLDRAYREHEAQMKAQADAALREANDNLGTALSRTGDPTGAAAAQIAGLKMDLNIAESQGKPLQGLATPYSFPADYSFLRGNALLRLGRREEARNSYRKAVAMDAGHANAWNNLVALSLGAKDMAGAKADIAKAEAAGAKIRPELKKAVGDLP